MALCERCGDRRRGRRHFTGFCPRCREEIKAKEAKEPTGHDEREA